MADIATSFEHIGVSPKGPLVAVRFSGVYPPGPEGNECGMAMVGFLRRVLAETTPAGVLFDLTGLADVSEGSLTGLAMPLYEQGKGFRPSVMVAGGRTAQTLVPLLEPRGLLGLAGMKLFERRSEAIVHLQRMVTNAHG